MLILKMLVLAAFVRIVISTERPLVCAVGYALFGLATGGIFGGSLAVIAIACVLDFLYAWGWFALLVRTVGTPPFWLVLFAGILLPVAARFLLSALTG